VARIVFICVRHRGSNLAINWIGSIGIALIHLPSQILRAPYHSIIGESGRGDTPNSSDGVVAHWSSHFAGAQSELIVRGPHGSFALPQTISELKRILRLHLAAVSASHQNAKEKNRRSADSTGQRAGRSVASTESKPAVGQPGTAPKETI
jgi:hypothetical protein